MRTLSRALVAAIPLVLAASACGPRAPCKPGDQQCADAAIARLPVHELSFWKRAMARPLDERIEAASPVLVDFLELENLRYAYPNRPRVPAPSPEFISQVRSAIDGLPLVVRQLAERKLAGVALVEDLGGSGFTDVVTDAGKETAGFIVLDAQVLASRRANAWATWKDNTPFKPAPGISLDVRVETDADDTVTNAIQYLFLHELGHVASIGASIHPSWVVAPKDVASTDAFAFFNLSWTVDRQHDRYTSKFDSDFPERASVAYYFGAKLAAADMVPVYRKLQKTNFATLYSVLYPADDFAEAFANYVHVILMHKPFEVRIAAHDGVMTYSSCWEEPRCADKRRIIESLLGAPKT